MEEGRSPARLSDFNTLSFDCYGTLIDWETGILESLSLLAARSPEPPGPDGMLRTFAAHEAAVEKEFPAMAYREVLAEVYRRAAREWRADAGFGEAEAFGLSAGDWEPFQDTVEALGYLKRHFRLAVLSNVDHANFSRTREKLGVEFDLVFLAEDIGSYKPSTENFRYMLEKLGSEGIGKRDLLHTAESLFHDHVPAKEIGLSTCWINRRAGKEGFGATSVPGSMPRVDFRFLSLAEMADAHRKEIGPGR